VATTTKRRMSMADSRGRSSTQSASAPPLVRAVSRLNRASTASASALSTNRGPYTSSPYSLSSSSGSPRALSESSDSSEFNPFSGTPHQDPFPHCAPLTLPLAVGAQSHWRTSAWPTTTELSLCG
jgi:hypothetical protein